MMTTQYTPAPYSEWRDVLNHLIAHPTDAPNVTCPTCGNNTIHIVFPGNPETRVGIAAVWCSTSQDGVISGRLRVPSAQEMTPWDEFNDQTTPFTIIPPEYIPSDDYEEKQF
ncbi:hypothetical protein [Dactylosporangium sp. CA-139066]|uniref:hypothetical protein n=1 Tax=Dactylosporangium sp. CA-139066 TaxID=3239930 RepID=UPI003D92C614